MKDKKKRLLEGRENTVNYNCKVERNNKGMAENSRSFKIRKFTSHI
jgi:hypothetical protein